MRMIPFHIEHLDMFDWKEGEREAYSVSSEISARITQALETNENAESWTLLHEGRIMAVGGLYRLSKKTGGAWMIFSRWADTSPVACARLIRKKFLEMIRRWELHRLTTVNRADKLIYNRWCEFLGFVPECVLEKYDDAGSAYVQYALVMEG